MPLDASTSKSLHGADIQTIPEIAAAFMSEAKALQTMETERKAIDVAIRAAWQRQAERFWIIRHIHGFSVEKFRKLVKIDHATAHDLVAYHEHREAIQKHIRQAQAVAIKAGETYRWPGWRRALGDHLGRAPRKDDVGKPDANVLAQTLIMMPQYRENEELKAQLAEAKALLAQRPRFRAYVAADGDDRPTPHYVFDHLNKIHAFDWDIAASATNTKVKGRYFDITRDALKQEWQFRCGWLNPPYSKKMITAFLQKAIKELQAGRCEKVVMLLPAWTDAVDWFSKYATWGHIHFIEGRLLFGNSKTTAFFPSIVVVLTKQSKRRGDQLSCSLMRIPKPRKL